MKVTVHVKTNSKIEGITQGEEGTLIVRVNTPPIEGKANERVKELLAEHYGVSRSRVSLLSGNKGKRKVFAID